MANLIGEMLAGRYRVDESLGRGGMAEVYKAWDKNRSSFLALKILHEDLAQDRIFLRRFKREAETLAKLQHPSIVRFYGLEQDGLQAYILMDYVEGVPLRTEIFQLDGKQMALDRLRIIVGQICGALHFAHNFGMVHCDLKPGNAMINKLGDAVVMDFGIARLTDAATATMIGMGTPAYMAPEQVKGLDPVPQTDIYALGVILYEMLTGGERPFTGEHATTTGTTSAKVRWEQVKLPPPSPRKYNPKITPELEFVVLKCLAKDPGDRYPTSLELLSALDLAVNEKETIAVSYKPQISPAAPSGEQTPETTYSPHVSDQTAPRATAVPELSWWQRNGGWLGVGGLLAAVLAVILLRGGSPPLLTKPTETHVPSHAATISPTITLLPTQFPSLTAMPVPALPEKITDDFGIPMVLVPAGEFEMGMDAGQSLSICKEFYEPYSDDECQRNWYEDEEPVHNVYLDDYYIDQYEVTNAAYMACMKEGVCASPYKSSSYTQDHYYGNSAYDDYPVIWVSWDYASTYCDWRGARLPTEAEWEKAARGTDGRVYPWGDAYDGRAANFCDQECEYDWANTAYNDGYTDTAPVGSYPGGVSPYGVMDMTGNIWEWVADWYDEDSYESAPSKNPQGPTFGDYRVLRGGSWYQSASGLRVAFRGKSYPDYMYHYVGFRCAASPE